MRLIFGEDTRIAEKFAEEDVKLIRKMEVKHYPKQKIYSSRKITRLLRSKDFVPLDYFQAKDAGFGKSL